MQNQSTHTVVRNIAWIVLISFSIAGVPAILFMAWQHFIVGDWMMAASLASPPVALLWLALPRLLVPSPKSAPRTDIYEVYQSDFPSRHREAP